jgi:glycosyltransferase involved in cell wall biosynthesis
LIKAPLTSDTLPVRVAYFLSHAVQYQSPLLRLLAAEGLAITTVYGDTSTAGTYFDADYGQEISWEQPLLAGYPSDLLTPPRFPGLFLEWKQSAGQWLDEHQPDAVWIHGWGTPFSIGCLLAAHERKLPILLRGETHLQSRKGTALWRWLHRLLVSKVFEQMEHLMAIGSANQAFYQHYGVPEAKITQVPYVTDNAFFQSTCLRAHQVSEELRHELGLSEAGPILLYVGRLSPEKDVPTLLKAMVMLQKDLAAEHRPTLLIAGSGPQIENYKAWSKLHLGDRVHFLGFVPQSKIPGLYDLCDVFILPSLFEPWGMVVNEVMNAGKALVLSDRVGAGVDLLLDGWNGFKFPAGNIKALADVLTRLLTQPDFCREAGNRSLELINQWGLPEALAGIKSVLSPLTRKPQSLLKAPLQRHGIELAYSGVHEIFQLAIAAEEMGELKALQCSFFDAEKHWGQWASKVTYMPSAFPLGSELLPPTKVRELPLTSMALQVAKRTYKGSKFDPLSFHQTFERMAARRLKNSDAAIAVAAETCALGYFEVAKRKGMKCVLDCHGIPVPFLDESLRKAANEFGLPSPPPCDSDAMTRHKEQERELADILLFCSELQRDIWISHGVPAEKCRALSLWVETSFWKPIRPHQTPTLPLRVLAVGAGTLAKGLPYLLQACDAVKDAVELTLVGSISPSMQPFVKAAKCKLTLLPYMSRTALRDFFATQHLLVMPSLGDSFGFIAIEAMACGIPVIVTDHCGVPVPDSEWRVPALDAKSLAARISHYLANPNRLTEDSAKALQFASLFPPSEYRRKAQAIYSELLAS